MSTSTQRNGCLSSGLNVIIALFGTIAKALAALLRFLYRVFLEGFDVSQIRNKSGFVLFWVTAVSFFLLGAIVMRPTRPSAGTAATAGTPMVVTVVTRLAQVEAPAQPATATPIPATATLAATATPRPSATATATATASARRVSRSPRL